MAGNGVNNRNTQGSNRNRSVSRNTSNNYRIPDVLEYKSVKTVKQVNNKKRKKKDNTMSVLIGLLGGSTVVAFLLCLVLLAQHFTGKEVAGSNGGGVTISTVPFEVDTKPHYVSINMESCTVVVGQSFTITVSAYPSELMTSVIWSSNNENVALVDDRGVVTIVGEGIAAITATSGECSDAIALEAVSSEGAQTSLGLPMYSKVESVTSEGSLAPVTPSQGVIQETDGNQSGNAEETQPYEPEGGNNSGGQSGNGNGQESFPTAGQPEQNTTGSQETTEEYTIPTLPTSEVTTPAADINTEDMFAVLTEAGFTQYISTACIYKENDTYMGEIIVEADSVHIYIKNRSESFDSAVKKALAYLLPSSSDKVWSTYISADTDKTISFDGRNVRIVLPAKNAHSQIIVFNN